MVTVSKLQSDIKANTRNKKSKHKPDLQPLKYEVEYDTKTDKIFVLPDLTVRSWLDLARRIGEYKPSKERGVGCVDDDDDVGYDFELRRQEEHMNGRHDGSVESDGDVSEISRKQGRKKKKKKHHRQTIIIAKP